MKKRKRLGSSPLDKALNRNKRREEKHGRKRRVGIAGSHKGQPNKRGLIPIEMIRTVLADSWTSSKSFGLLKRILNLEFLTVWEERYYTGDLEDEKRILASHKLRYGRWVEAMRWFKDMQPRPSESTSKHLHLHGKPKDLTEFVRQQTLKPRTEEELAMVERHRSEWKALEKTLKEKETKKLLDFKAELEKSPKRKKKPEDYEPNVEDAEFEVIDM